MNADPTIHSRSYFIGCVTMFDDRVEVSDGFAERREAEQWCRDWDHGTGGRVRSAYTCQQVDTWDERGPDSADVAEVEGSRRPVAFP